MKTGLLRGAILLAAPLFAVSAAATVSSDKDPQNVEQEQAENKAESASEEKPEALAAPEAKTEEKRICRRVRLDASSRRATKVCKTSEEWRLFNQRR